MRYRYLPSPLGDLLLAGDDRGLQAIGFAAGKGKVEPAADWHLVTDSFADAAAQLDAYFAGTRRRFELQLCPSGTAFQLAVLDALAAIPYGETRSYREIAAVIGRPAAVRAVGAANGRNPLPIVIPCHRVIGADGSLTGYAGGLEWKRYLLDLEGADYRQP